MGRISIDKTAGTILHHGTPGGAEVAPLGPAANSAMLAMAIAPILTRALIKRPEPEVLRYASECRDVLFREGAGNFVPSDGDGCC